MTLTQLAQKHNLEPERAKAFLREWLERQQTYWIYDVDGKGNIYQGCTGEDAKSIVTTVSEAFPGSGKPFPLIGRPTDLGE